jgi:hypothetical protein
MWRPPCLKPTPSEPTDQVVGGQGAAGDRDPGRRQLSPAGQLAQGELSRLGCWLRPDQQDNYFYQLT